MIKSNHLFPLILFLSVCAKPSLAQKITISGFVLESGSKEALFGASLYEPVLKIGATSNAYGFYSLTLNKKDSLTLEYSYLGYKKQRIKLRDLSSDTIINVLLIPDIKHLKGVKIIGYAEMMPISSDEDNAMVFSIQKVNEIPAILGEKDPLKALQLMPGVSNGREGFGNLFVRGGSGDQNLFLLDGATVYNAFHLFGFLSVFNPDALRDIKITKGGFPARFGGRLSSIVDIKMREGNMEKIQGQATVGLIASKFTIEGPIKENKLSFLFSGRRTYADLLLSPFVPKKDRTSVYFYDANAKLHWKIGEKDDIYVSGYIGRDFFKFNFNDGGATLNDGFNWGNATAGIRWNHILSNRTFIKTHATFSYFKFNVFSEEKENNDKFFLNYFSGIRDFSLKSDLEYFPNPKHNIKTGVALQLHQFTLSALVTKNTRLNLDKLEKDITNGLEFSTYIEDLFKPSKEIAINFGLRFSNLSVNGSNYSSLEPRLSVNYSLNDDFQIKGSVSYMNQYIHLLSNSGEGLPTDIWIPASDKIAPQKSIQYDIGLYKKNITRGLTASASAYYKTIDNLLGYKEGASFLVLDLGTENSEINKVDIADNVTTGIGEAKGFEFYLSKNTEKWNGWLSYTLSWVRHKLDDVNDNQFFWAKHDRRHDVSVVISYQVNKSLKISGTWVYNSGVPITLPASEFNAPKHFQIAGPRKVSEIIARNNFRMPVYHRLDLGFQWNKKKKKNRERIWELSFYNAYFRSNPFYLTTDVINNNKVLSGVALFPIIPSVSYTLKF